MFQSVLTNVSSFLISPKTQHTIDTYTVVEEKLLSEGGFAYVYRVHDIKNPA